MYKFTIIEKGLGEIQLNDYKEAFKPDFLFWSEKEYNCIGKKLAIY